MNPNLARFVVCFLLLSSTRALIPLSAAQSRTAFATLKQNGHFVQSKTPIQARIDRLWAQAEALGKREQNQQALDLYRQAQRISQRHDEPLRLANLYADISTTYYFLGQFDQALQEARSGLARLPVKIPGSDSIRFKLFSTIGTLYLDINRADSSRYYLEKAENLISQSPELELVIPAYISYFYSNLSSLFNKQADFPKVLLYAEKALQVAQKHQLTDYYSLEYNNLGAYYQSTGDSTEAIRQYQLALRYTKSAFFRSYLSNNIGTLYLETGDYPNALTYLREARRCYQAFVAGDPGQKNAELGGRILTNLGTCYTKLDQFGEARRVFDQAGNLLVSSLGPHNTRLAELYVQRGGWQEAQGNWSAALDEYQKALHASYWNGRHPDAYQVLPPDDEAISLVSLFDVLRHRAAVFGRLYEQNHQQRDLQASLDTYQATLQLSDKIRRGYEEADAKLFFVQKVRPVYEQALEAAFHLYTLTQHPRYREAAFSILEGSKAAALADALRETRLKPATLPASLLKEEKARNQQLAELKIQLATARDPIEVQNLKAQLMEQQIQLNQVLRQFDRVSPRFYQFRYAQHTVSLQRARQSLPDNRTALLSYFLGTNYFYTFAISQHGEQFQRQPLTSVLRQSLDTLRRSLYTNPGIEVYGGSSAAQRVYRILMAPLEASLRGAKRLIVLRDAELHFIPFEVLEATPGRYLVEQYAIRYAYSVTLLVEAARQTTPFNGQTLAIAPYADSVGLAVQFRNQGLGALPASRHEALKVGGQVLLNGEATKEAFLKTYAQYGILHLATHARADDRDPSESFIAFFPGSFSYKLYTNELYNLALDHTRLVVLSACETGSGLLQGGEGIMSLARAFIYAGCPSVITTLWSAHDESSAYLSEHLHTYLHRGVAIDEALQRTKLDYVRSELGQPFNHPYYWANFVLIGEGNALYGKELTQPISTRWIVAGGVGLVVLAALAGYYLALRRKWIA